MDYEGVILKITYRTNKTDLSIRDSNNNHVTLPINKPHEIFIPGDDITWNDTWAIIYPKFIQFKASIPLGKMLFFTVGVYRSYFNKPRANP